MIIQPHNNPISVNIAFDIRRYLPAGWYLPAAYIVKCDPDGTLTYIVQQATTDTIGSYAIQQTPLIMQLFSLISTLSEKALEQKFNPPKGKPRSLEQLLEDEIIKKNIEQYVHRQMGFFLSKMTEHRLPLTFMAERKVLLENVRVRYPNDELVPRLIFRKTKEGVIYRLNFRNRNPHDNSMHGEPWLVRWKNVVPLTNQPAWLMVNDMLYFLPDLNGYMVKPFINKDEIPVPSRVLRSYFQKFILKTVERTEIEAHGFDITTNRKMLGCELSLAPHFFHDSWFITVKFLYKGASFAQNDPCTLRTALHFESESDIRILQVKRDPEAEQQWLERLCSLGLREAENGFWEIPDTDDEALFQRKFVSFQRGVQWLSAHVFELEASGFSVALPTWEGKNVCIAPASWSLSPEVYEWASGKTTITTKPVDWFDLNITVTVGEFSFSFARLINHIREKDSFYPLPDGSFFLIPEEWMVRFHALAHLGKVENDTICITKSQWPILEKLIGTGMTPPVEPEENRNLPSSNTFQSIYPRPQLNEELNLTFLKADLRPYQIEGVRWLIQHYREGLGACLADDMGLGKTLQTLAVLVYTRQNLRQHLQHTEQHTVRNNLHLEFFTQYSENPDFESLRALILLPASLVFNWHEEIKKFAPSLSTCRHIGPQRSKDARILRRYDIVLTTYQTAQKDLDVLRQIDWTSIILDESQYIKNPESAIFKAVGSLTARHRISLSGTPIENSLSDLWAQMQFLNPGMLGSFKYFQEHYIRPIEKQGDEMKKQDLKDLVKPYLLRRTKEDVARDLPPLTETIFYSEMTDTQRKRYEQEKSAVRNHILKIDETTLSKNRVAILASLTRLRQLANHPLLLKDNETCETYSTYQETGKKTADLSESGKFNDVIEFWNTIRRSGHKVLIFSFFESFLQLFKAEFEREKFPFAWLTGQVSPKKRKEEVQRFNEDPAVQAFLMTTTAGGVGLNLTAADYVFVLDPWWNPFRESQAIARAHRIGQTKNVMAVKFIARESIEEKIIQLQQRKSHLASEFLDLGDKVVLTKEDFLFLL